MQKGIVGYVRLRPHLCDVWCMPQVITLRPIVKTGIGV